VENHGGIITASSELGKGAVFSIYLPVSKSQFLDGYGAIRAELLARDLSFMNIEGQGTDDGEEKAAP
jgi:hypothetical protein